MFKKILTIFVAYFVLYSPYAFSTEYVNTYATVFNNRSIYDQSAVRTTVGEEEFMAPENEKVDKQTIQELFKQKQRLLQGLFVTYDREIQSLRALNGKYPSSSLSNAVASSAPFVCSLLVPGLGIMAQATMGGALAVQFSHTYNLPVGHLTLDQLISTIELKKGELVSSLDKDPGCEYEYGYVLRKRFLEIEYPELISHIENALCARRKSSELDFARINFIKNVLNLPTSKKILDKFAITPMLESLSGSENSLNSDYTRLSLSPDEASRNEAVRKLKYYHSDTFKQINDLIFNIILNSSQTEKGERSTMNRFFYVLGDPGSGKTELVKIVCELLGLPYNPVSLRNPEADLSSDAIEGSGWLTDRPNIGLLAQTLLASTKVESQKNLEVKIKERHRLITIERASYKTCKNGVLIIDDFHTAWEDPKTEMTTLKFLLHYLDSQTQSFFSPYFQATIPIENIFIIFTGNTPIPETDIFHPVRSRINKNIIKLLPPPPAVKRIFIEDEIKKMKIKYKLTEADTLSILSSISTDLSMRETLMQIERTIGQCDWNKTTLLNSMVKNNDPEARYQLGLKYLKGVEVPKDQARALRNLARAFNLGHEAAGEKIKAQTASDLLPSQQVLNKYRRAALTPTPEQIDRIINQGNPRSFVRASFDSLATIIREKEEAIIELKDALDGLRVIYTKRLNIIQQQDSEIQKIKEERERLQVVKYNTAQQQNEKTRMSELRIKQFIGSYNHQVTDGLHIDELLDILKNELLEIKQNY